jgi:hypothetical protein
VASRTHDVIVLPVDDWSTLKCFAMAFPHKKLALAGVFTSLPLPGVIMASLCILSRTIVGRLSRYYLWYV